MISRGNRVDAVYVIEPEKANYPSISRHVKRIADVVFAVIMLVVASPLLGILALLVRRDGGPILFRQQRVGLDGRLFEIIKLRSMVVDAESILEHDMKLRERYALSYSIPDDIRATRIGSIMRAMHLDEIPQLWNVLRGEMSLVGPRPVLPEETQEYGNYKSAILSVPPGLTGFWQINRHIAPEYPERAKMEAVYIQNWSLLLDMRVALCTAGYIAKRTAKEIARFI